MKTAVDPQLSERKAEHPLAFEVGEGVVNRTYMSKVKRGDTWVGLEIMVKLGASLMLLSIGPGRDGNVDHAIDRFCIHTCLWEVSHGLEERQIMQRRVLATPVLAGSSPAVMVHSRSERNISGRIRAIPVRALRALIVCGARSLLSYPASVLIRFTNTCDYLRTTGRTRSTGTWSPFLLTTFRNTSS
jgi:hypothetical protein